MFRLVIGVTAMWLAPAALALGQEMPTQYKEVLTTLKCSEGDSVYLTDSAEGGVLLSPADPSFAEQVEIAGKIMKRYRNTLRELAK